MDVDGKPFFHCWGVPTSSPNAARTFTSSNGYYGFMPRALNSDCSEPTQSQEAEKSIQNIIAGRKRTYNEMCSGVNYVKTNNRQFPCSYKTSKVEESNTWLVHG